MILTLLVTPNPKGHAQQEAVTPQRAYSQGDPTDDEQYLLQKLNRARMDPVGEGQRLAAWLRDTTVGQEVITYYGTNPEQVIADFAALPAVPPLAFDADLIAAARGHSDDEAAHNEDSHTGTDGSTPESRIAASGYAQAGAAENAGIQDSLDSMHAGYLVDWGNPGLGHRINCMDGSRSVYAVGIGDATVPGDNYVANTEDFGMPKYIGLVLPAMLTGVVYHDAAGTGEYAQGEGIAGVTVSMDGGTYYAVTTASGGYSLPLVNMDGSNATGTVSVRMTFPDGGGTQASVTITPFSGEYGTYLGNVEWDATDADDLLLPFDPNLPRFKGKAWQVEAGGVAEIKILRPLGSDQSQAFTVLYKAKGTVAAGVDYQPLPGTLTIPAGAMAAKVQVTALTPRTGTATLILKLKGVPGKLGKATVTFLP